MEENNVVMNACECVEETVQQPAWEVVPDPIDMDAVEEKLEEVGEVVEDALEDPVRVRIEKLGEDTRRITVEGGDFLNDLSL